MQSFLPYLLAKAAEALSQDLATIYGGEHGLGRAEWRILVALYKAGPELSRDLVPLTALDKVQISRGVARLEAKGLIDKTPQPQDARARLLSLTETGEALYAQVMPQVEARSKELLADLSPEQEEALRDMLRQVASRCRELSD
jgi:DNA-binding MarR family transcriptional regulator